MTESVECFNFENVEQKCKKREDSIAAREVDSFPISIIPSVSCAGNSNSHHQLLLYLSDLFAFLSTIVLFDCNFPNLNVFSAGFRKPQSA